jgi:hypothetical protein
LEKIFLRQWLVDNNSCVTVKFSLYNILISEN